MDFKGGFPRSGGGSDLYFPNYSSIFGRILFQPMQRKNSKYILFSLIIGLGVALDQVTKVLAVEHFKGQPEVSYWDGFFRFIYAENDGAFLSLGSSLSPTLRMVLLTIIPGIVLVGMMVYLLRSEKLKRYENIAFALIAAGGIGNIVDRIMAGFVVDFMNMELFGLRTGIFNVADLYIVFGIILFVLGYFFVRRKEELAEKNAASVDSDS